jgi:hypothetical protein
MSLGRLKMSKQSSKPLSIQKQASGDVPLNLLSRFQAYAVGLIGVRRRNGPTHGGTRTSIKTGDQRCGSGTLVRSNGRHFVLTAAHCARELAKWDDIGLVLTSSPSPFTIPVSSAVFIGEWASDELGPDLAFLPIPSDKLAVINDFTTKLFWNLDRHQAEMLKDNPEFGDGLWVLTGAPDVYSRVPKAHTQELRLMAYRLGSVGWPMTNGDFDYVHAPMLGQDMPNTFKGMSGGGLWRADIERHQDGSFASIGRLRLEGCAFYELPLEDRCLVIRCHGRRSIYRHALASLQS